MAHKAVVQSTTSLRQSLSVVASDSWALRLALSDLGSSHIAVCITLAHQALTTACASMTAMVVTPFTAMGTASAVLALSKAAWKLGNSLSKLDQGTKIVDTTVKNLAGEVKSLGNECELVYAELEEVSGKSETGSTLPYDADGRMWSCLVTQVEETSRTIQELELFVKSIGGEESSFINQPQRQRKRDKSKDQIASIRIKICRHTENWRTMLLLVNT